VTEPAKALLLDLDGTLVVTDELHFEATMLVLPEFDLSMDRATYMAEIHGGANDDIKRFLFGDRAETLGTEYVARKEARFRGLLESVPVVPGSLDLLDRARARGLGLAVVTNAPRPNAELLLAPFGGEKAFDTVILGDELEHGKPHPMPYLTGLSLLGVDARNACGFEDSISGVTALVRAGVNAIEIGEGLYANDLMKAGARHVVPNMAWGGLVNITEVTELFTPLIYPDP
jgi:HAD superfamily hydrolase (TIGR01509 family)